MIVGLPEQFAIESGISEAFECLSDFAIGYFTIHIGGYRYGRHEPDSTAMGCSFDEVGRRVTQRGNHVAPFANEQDAGLIAESIRNAIYAEEGRESYFGLPAADFSEVIYSNDLLWAPDGDEAFDDGSYVLQFDVEDQVRLIGFKTDGAYSFDPSTLRDIWIPLISYYDILANWRLSFETERTALLRAETRTRDYK